VTTSDLTPTLARRFGYPVLRGAVVNVVRPRSPADRAGIRPAVREEEFNGLNFPSAGT
jgi:S1-C subfamily serine protease